MPTKPPITRETILKKIKELTQQCDKEGIARMDIERSKDYKAAQKDIDDTEATVRDLLKEIADTRARQQEMLAVVPDSRPALDSAKREIIELMKLEGVEGYAEDWISAVGKFSEKKGVDGRKLIAVLGGDIDEFLRIVRPTQKAVQLYADEHIEIKKPLLACIKLESRELVDVDIQLPETL